MNKKEKAESIEFEETPIKDEVFERMQIFAPPTKDEKPQSNVHPIFTPLFDAIFNVPKQ